MLPPISPTEAALMQDRARAERMQDHLVPPLAQVPNTPVPARPEDGPRKVGPAPALDLRR